MTNFKPFPRGEKAVRIQASAALLIRQGKMNIADIAAMVGYESPGKFTAVFKKIMGVTPSEYRKHPLSRPIGLPAETTKD